MSKLENEFAKSLKDSGLKFERNCRDLPGTPDVVFREQKLAVFFMVVLHHTTAKSQRVMNGQRI